MCAFIDGKPVRNGFAECGPEADIVIGGGSNNLAHRGIADAACRIIDNPLERLFVIGVDHQAEVGYDIFDLLALIEREAAVNLIRHAPFAQSLFEDTALGIGTIKDGEVGVFIIVLATQLRYFIGHNVAFFHITVSLKDPDGLTPFLLGEHLFGDLPLVLFDQAVGRTDNGLGGTVVLLQLEDFGIGIYLGEIQNIVNVRSPEGVDALRVVAHHAYTLILLCQLQHDAVLCIVGVLILVDKHIAELLAIACQHVRKVAEKDIGIDQQIIEIHCSGLPATLPVAAVDIPYGRHLCGKIALVRLLVGCVSRRRHQVVLRIGDACLHTAGLIGLLIKPHLFDDGTNQALAVRRIVDGELRRKADMGRLGTKNTGKNRMERTHPKESCTLLAHLPGNTLLHFTGSFVSESQCQDIPGIVTVLEQIGYLISEHTRLSGTGTGDDQRRAITVEHRRTLAFIKFFDIVGHKIYLLNLYSRAKIEESLDNSEHLGPISCYIFREMK